MNLRLAVVGGGAVLVALALAGCGTGSAGTPGGGGGTPGAAAAPAGAGGPTITVTDPPTGPTPPVPGAAAGPARPPECTVGQLSIELAAGSAGATHRSAALVFRNTGAATCRMRGYPGVAGLDSRGTQIEQARRTPSGYLGGLTSGGAAPTVDLAPGRTASALIEAVAAKPDGSACTAYAGLLVTPPDETHSVRLGWTGDGCAGLEIHPVVPGRTGQQG
jgi:Protein of unknown function (DUF4232)